MASSLIEDLDLTAALDHLAVAIFAVAGGLVAGQQRMNVPSFVLVAGVSGVAGRDLATGVVPATRLGQPSYLISCLVAAGIALILTKSKRLLDRLVLWMDALGLSLSWALGTHIALKARFPMIVAPIAGVLSASFGVLASDVLVGGRPLPFKKEICVLAALAGAVALFGFSLASDAYPVNLLLGFLACFAVRGLTSKFGRSLPACRSRRRPETLRSRQANHAT